MSPDKPMSNTLKAKLATIVVRAQTATAHDAGPVELSALAMAASDPEVVVWLAEVQQR